MAHSLEWPPAICISGFSGCLDVRRYETAGTGRISALLLRNGKDFQATSMIHLRETRVSPY
jgi:hypothetical protein